MRYVSKVCNGGTRALSNPFGKNFRSDVTHCHFVMAAGGPPIVSRATGFETGDSSENMTDELIKGSTGSKARFEQTTIFPNHKSHSMLFLQAQHQVTCVFWLSVSSLDSLIRFCVSVSDFIEISTFPSSYTSFYYSLPFFFCEDRFPFLF
eukprot:gb/GEZN01019532.1/.p1 GENE.gb/GEZN01019532.1/~~gb/GEZN01019532.1/.p1  ORF type:complete len:150 (+),score=5.84 gb/GEZN01019532.1/:264-713(+)